MLKSSGSKTDPWGTCCSNTVCPSSSFRQVIINVFKGVSKPSSFSLAIKSSFFRVLY